MEELSRAGARLHKVSMINRQTCTISGVNDVISFDIHEILLETEQGRLAIKGASCEQAFVGSGRDRHGRQDRQPDLSGGSAGK